jgi:alpha-1,2-mannosyltransferase
MTNKYLKNFRFWLAFCLANFAWFALMTSQPHKEERFMYVIYPGIVLLGGFVLGIMGNKTRTVVLIAIGIVSASRILQVQIGYSGPMAVWEGLSAKVCVGGEWYTYPSNYYTTGELFYYSDGFKGLLPGKFGESFIMNNQNREEKDRYIPLESCEYVVALNTTEKPLKNELKSWKIEKSALYLDPSTKQPFRSFYLPLGKNVYGTYLLLKNPKF